MMAPQALVIKVVDRLWQEVVSELADHTHLVICDVSQPTNNLKWEVENMLARRNVRCVFVGDSPMVQTWAQADSDSNLEAPAARMKSLLHGQTILVFDPSQQFAQRKFNRNLRNSLENVSNTTKPTTLN